jgi:hypothetical protein
LPSTFALARHASTRFALNGRHAELACAECHRRVEEGGAAAGRTGATLGRARVPLSVVRTACETCHRDPHEGRFEPGGARARTQHCVACHDQASFTPSLVDAKAHEAFGFPITGAHLNVRCEGCHKEMKRPQLASSLLGSDGPRLAFTIAAGDCSACHKGPHGTQFALTADNGGCGRCHAADTFKGAARFDHDRGSRFPLLRAHRSTACRKCHDATRTADGTLNVTYRPLSLNCRECHLRTGAAEARGLVSAPGPPVSARRQ